MSDSPFLVNIYDNFLSLANIKASVFRLDKLHSNYSGNKYYKLKPLDTLLPLLKQGIVSFGGRWSNHLLALSQYGADHHLKTIAIIRDAATRESTPLLDQCIKNGMQIHFVSSAFYRDRHKPAMNTYINKHWPNAYVLPEGGSQSAAVTACQQIISDLNNLSPNHTDSIILPVGTGTTMAGICQATHKECHVYGVAVTKKYKEQEQLIHQYCSPKNHNWSINREEKLGRYGQLNSAIIAFIKWFETTHNIPLDPIYTAKSFYWFYNALQQNLFTKNQNIVLLHTGGLWGRKGYPEVFKPSATVN